MEPEKIIQVAEFNPNIKRYLLYVGALIMTLFVIGIPFLPFWFLGVGQYFSRRFYESLECRLTNKHLDLKKGFLFRVEKTIPLENIQDLTFKEDPFLKFFDLRVLKIETAGQSNPEGSDMKLMGIIDSLEFKQLVLDQRAKLKSEDHQVMSPLPADNDQIAILREIRDLLKSLVQKS